MGKDQPTDAAHPCARTDWIVLHGGALGDLVLTLQLALRLPGVDSGTTLRVVSRTDPGDLSKCRPSVERISPEGLGGHWLHALGDAPSPQRLRELLAGRQVLNAQGGVDSVVHRRLMDFGPRDVYSFDPRPQPELDTHITTQWQRELERQGLLLPKGICQGRDRGVLVVPDELRERGREVFERAGALGRSTAGTEPGRLRSCSTPILIHPGSGGRAKCWPLGCFLEVGRRLRQLGSEVCFVVGPVERDRWAAADLQGLRGEFPLIECPEPDELLSLLAAARVLISNDAGPAHLAALIGTLTVTVFGPTSPTVWRPLGPAARHIHGDPESHPDDWGIDPTCVLAIVKGRNADAKT